MKPEFKLADLSAYKYASDITKELRDAHRDSLARKMDRAIVSALETHLKQPLADMTPRQIVIKYQANLAAYKRQAWTVLTFDGVPFIEIGPFTTKQVGNSIDGYRCETTFDTVTLGSN